MLNILRYDGVDKGSKLREGFMISLIPMVG